MDKNNLRLAIEYGLQRNGYTELRPNQEEILKQVLNGRDILFCSPTGSGKSLIFEVAPFAFHFLGQMKSCCIVVSPFAALMKSKAQELKLRGTNVIYLREFPIGYFKISNLHLLVKDTENWIKFCLFDLILYVPSTIFQLNRDGSSWLEPVLS